MLTLVLCFLTEIEAKKACDWLRAAGFPQYAQLYEGGSCLLTLLYLLRASVLSRFQWGLQGQRPQLQGEEGIVHWSYDCLLHFEPLTTAWRTSQLTSLHS